MPASVIEPAREHQGTQRITVEAARGTPGNPPSEQDLMVKFENLAARVLSPVRTQALAAKLDQLEHLPDVGSLTALTIPAAG